jgi:hypothetical protein
LTETNNRPGIKHRLSKAFEVTPMEKEIKDFKELINVKRDLNRDPYLGRKI